MRSMASTPTPGTFFVAIWEAWGTRMSGFISVPLTALAVFWPASDLRWLWIIMALSALCYTIYGTWARERKRVVELEEKSRPKLKIECRMDLLGCRTEPTKITMADRSGNPVGFKIARYFRAAVRTDNSEPIHECRGLLTEISKDGTILWGGDTQVIDFAPANAGDAQSKTIHQLNEFLDILGITDQGEILICAPKLFWRFKSLSLIFSTPGDCFLTIEILGKNIGSVVERLKFYWSGSWETSALTLVN
jgi:hypothetical protein